MITFSSTNNIMFQQLHKALIMHTLKCPQHHKTLIMHRIQCQINHYMFNSILRINDTLIISPAILK
ncbi:hypothetical protein ACJIZ3_001461 [Penstemon smallii]|uniref:Uncharacterized protein n=1 Tax=Penstemon smallii TaxID=265156 RepID=A0ABD3U652_9LAMI